MHPSIKLTINSFRRKSTETRSAEFCARNLTGYRPWCSRPQNSFSAIARGHLWSSIKQHRILYML
jgi:hypothetical protein